jgi:hypothetical protein
VTTPATLGEFLDELLRKKRGSQRLTAMEIDRVDLVDVGANGRRFAVLKRDAVGKADVVTFEQLMASDQMRDWLPGALSALGDVVWAAMYPPDPDDPALTPAMRLQAVANSVDEFKAGLLDRVATAIGEQQTEKRAAIRKAGSWGGIVGVEPLGGSVPAPIRKDSSRPWRGLL